MLEFENLNVNPKKRKTGDCSTRAIVACLGIDYNQALDLQLEEVKKSYYDFSSRQVVESVLKKYGYTKMKRPVRADNTRYMVKEMDKIVSAKDLVNGVIVNVANHYVTLKGNKYIDI